MPLQTLVRTSFYLKAFLKTNTLYPGKQLRQTANDRRADVDEATELTLGMAELTNSKC